MRRGLIALFAFVCIAATAQARLSVASIAAGTTIAVNAGTIAKWVRHPKREGKKTAKAVKDVVKGRN